MWQDSAIGAQPVAKLDPTVAAADRASESSKLRASERISIKDKRIEEDEKARLERDKLDAAQIAFSDIFRYSNTRDRALLIIGKLTTL